VGGEFVKKSIGGDGLGLILSAADLNKNQNLAVGTGKQLCQTARKIEAKYIDPLLGELQVLREEQERLRDVLKVREGDWNRREKEFSEEVGALRKSKEELLRSVEGLRASLKDANDRLAVSIAKNIKQEEIYPN
jgi:hypothetical protein